MTFCLPVSSSTSPSRHWTGQNFMQGVRWIERYMFTQDGAGQGFSASGASGSSSSSVNTLAKYM